MTIHTIFHGEVVGTSMRLRHPRPGPWDLDEADSFASARLSCHCSRPWTGGEDI